jgi:uncharacterized membrane protein
MFRRFENINPASFLVMAALVMELLLNLVTPPLQAPDEFSHFYRSYQVSEGYFLPLKQDQRLGGYIPEGINDFIDQYKQPAYIYRYTLSYRELARSFKIGLQPNDRRFRDFANTAYYSPVSYLPQSLMLGMLRQFSAPPAVLYYAGRLFVFFIWLFCMYRVIRFIPVFKWLFTFLALLPTNLYVANSFSADTVTNILSFLFIAIALQHIFVTSRITGRHLLVLALVLALLAMAKVVYIGLVVLLFAIPGHKFSSRAHRFLGLGILFLLSAFLSGLWSEAVMRFYVPMKDYNPNYSHLAFLSPCGDYYAQQAYILSHGLYFFRVFWHSLADHPNTYLTGYAGVFGNGDIGLPTWLYVIGYSLIVFLVLTEKNTFHFTGMQKLFLFLAAACAFVLLVLSQHLIWDCPGEGVVDMLQGRYLVPVFPLVFLLFSNSGLQLRFNPSVVVVPVVALLCLNSCWVIYDRYFIGPHALVSELYCDAEEIDAYNAFKTSDPAIFLNNASNRNDKEHRSGKASALLSPAAPFCFTHMFKNLRKGDLIEAEAWQKGNGGLLVISAKQAGCKDFYLASALKGHREKSGWQRVRNICELTLDCDSAEVGFYAWNPGKDPVYLDDVKLTIKRFNDRPD